MEIDLVYRCNRAKYIILINRICTFWTEHYIEQADQPIDGLKEIFIYKNKATRESVKEHGCIDENHNDFVHVLRGRGIVTVVVGSHDAPIRAVIDAVFASS